MEKLKKIAIVTTHPIQYNAPLFKLLAERNKVRVKVFYTWGESVLKSKYDPGFKKEIEWDIPLLEGYEYEFLENIAVDKGSHHFKGIDNPGSIQAIASYEPNAILIYGWAFKSHLRLIRYFHKKIPIIFRGDSTLLDEVGDGYKSVLRKFFLRWVYKKVDYALYVGKNNFDYFKRAALRKDHLIYAPHAVDNDRFEASDRSIEQAAHYRRKLGINDGGIVFLFAGCNKTEDAGPVTPVAGVAVRVATAGIPKSRRPCAGRSGRVSAPCDGSRSGATLSRCAAHAGIVPPHQALGGAACAHAPPRQRLRGAGLA